LDASDTTTITASSGAVSEWRDRSGNGRHVTQATAANQPTTGASTKNARNVITFDGSDWLGPTSSGFNPASTGVTLFAVAQANSGSAISHIILSQQDGTGLGRSWLYSEVPPGTVGWSTFLGGSATAVGIDTTSWVSMRVSCAAGASQTLSIVHNSSTTVTATRTLEAATGGFMVGTRKNNFSTQALNGAIAEIVLYNSVLSASDIGKVNTYLNDKWAVY
jgi:hypothetical protein